MFGTPLSLILIVALGWIALSTVADGAEQYPLGPDSQPQDVPHGAVTHHTWTSRVFPGTTRDYWVYVPAQYTADKPACVMIFQDGGGYVNDKGRMRIPVVFDNLIAKGEMPVTIGIFINPGNLPPVAAGLAGRPNRSFEYDAVSDRYARFLLEEILPEVGKEYKLSQDPNDRALCGTSSGGICAFTAAWFRPDAFRRILSIVGSFSNLRGGDQYPSLIRKSETKPLRVFLQSGKRDMNTYAGSWYIQNQAMADAFEYLGYDYKVVLGDEGHNDLQGSSILPDALRWLWRDHPQPIVAPVPPANRQWATDIVIPGKGWEPVAEHVEFPSAATDKHGGAYYAEPSAHGIWYVDAQGHKRMAYEGIAAPSGLRLSPDGSLLFVAEAGSRWVESLQVQPDGSLANGEAFYRLETADESSLTGARGMAVDTAGYLYVATEIGIQVGDLEGRTAFVMANPPGGPATSLAFGGPDFHTLYAIAGGRVFRRPVTRQGVR